MDYVHSKMFNLKGARQQFVLHYIPILLLHMYPIKGKRNDKSDNNDNWFFLIDIFPSPLLCFLNFLGK